MKDNAANLLKHNEFYLFVVILILGLLLTFFTEDFFSFENLFDVVLSYSFLGIMAVGLVVVLISGGIDISFTATATVSQYLMAVFIIKYGGGWSASFIIPIFIGVTLGAVNALLVYYLQVHSIIVTIATLNIFYGLLIFFTRGKWIYNFPEWFSEGFSLFEISAADGTTYSLSFAIIALLIVIALTWFLLNRTTIGRQIYAMGGNPDAARRMGFHMRRLHLCVYCYMGLLAGIAGLVQAQMVQTVAPNSMVGRELDVVAAVVLGGASLVGGAGTLLGTILGVALIAIMENGLTLLGVSAYWHKVIIGLIFIISVSLTAYNRKLKEEQYGRIEV